MNARAFCKNPGKSSYSGNTGGDCVEVADGCLDGAVPVRDSKNPSGPVVTVGAPAWQRFVDGLCRPTRRA